MRRTDEKDADSAASSPAETGGALSIPRLNSTFHHTPGTKLNVEN